MMKKISVKGRRFAYEVTGKGSPTVVLETGVGAESGEWSPVVDTIAKSKAVFRYDRAGRGESDPGQGNRDALTMVGELNALLEATQTKGPYLLVGHSFGGLLTRLFASARIVDAYGLVLVGRFISGRVALRGFSDGGALANKEEISAMALPTTSQLQELMDRLANSWSAGNGREFGAAFTDDAHFVAFDGTVLEGPAAIGQYHQAAFDRYLQNTSLVVSVDGTRAIDESALLVFASGGIRSTSGGAVMLTGDSLQTMVVVVQEGKARVLAFQNTRRRPITDGDSAGVWREFDSLWSLRHARSDV